MNKDKSSVHRNNSRSPVSEWSNLGGHKKLKEGEAGKETYMDQLCTQKQEVLMQMAHITHVYYAKANHITLDAISQMFHSSSLNVQR